VGEFAGILVHKLEEAGYSEMFGAVILSIFASAGAFVMIGTAHFQKKYNIAMANASGAITQVPFLVLPIAMIMLALFTQTGVIPALDNSNGVIPIDIHTTSAILLGFPSMLVLWKAVQDDGKVNWLETSTMVAIFLLVIYLLVAHG
jgi:Ca2+/H+ antiporter